MKREEIFGAWTPSNSPWSRWVKPVLFAHMASEVPVDSASVDTAIARSDAANIDFAPGASERNALVLDLPGEEALTLGIALARRKGYRLIPLFNAVPSPPEALLTNVGSDSAPLLLGLIDYAACLAGVQLPDDAPPAFLLDANRAGKPGAAASEGYFDNRSLSFPSDFPSGDFLTSLGIRGVGVVQAQGGPQLDLSYTLNLWQREGLQIREYSQAAGEWRDIVVSRPGRLGWAFHRALALLRLSRNPISGFGAMVFPQAGG